MWLYILIYFIVVLIVGSAKKQKQQQDYFKYIMIFLAVFVGITDMFGGYDRYIYCELWDEVADAIRDGVDVRETRIFEYYTKEVGFLAWNLITALVSRNRYIFILLTTFLLYFLLYRGIKRQTENPLFALIPFFALTFFFSFTYLRQMLAAGFAWQALQYVEKRNLKMFALWVLIGFSFHNSALIFFPVYFIPFRKFNLKWSAYAILASLILGVSGFSSALFDAYASVDAERINAAGYSIDIGFRWAYLIEALFFYYFIHRYYDKLGNDNSSLIGLNLSIIFCCILLLFIKSDNGGRLGWYFLIGLYSILSSIFAGKKKLANPLFMIIVCLFLYIRILNIWGIQLYPYKTFFTPGIREGDNIEEIYEYDHNYDKDKFYR